MRDFQEWLSHLPDETVKQDAGEKVAIPIAEVKGIPEEGYDRFSLLSEFIALRQEVRLQNREHARALSAYDKGMELYEKGEELFREKSQNITDLEERVRLATEKKVIMMFIDVRDALVRGLDAGIKISKSKRLFRPAPRGIEGIVEGYEIAIRRFDRVLKQAGIEQVKTLGCPFDPKIMKAVEGREAAGEEERNMVLEEYLGAFIRGKEVIRPAEVVVGKP